MLKQIIEVNGNMVEVLINEAGEVVEMLSNGEVVKVTAEASKGLVKTILTNKKVLIAAGVVAVVAGGIIIYKKRKAKKAAKLQEEIQKNVVDMMNAMMNEDK